MVKSGQSTSEYERKPVPKKALLGQGKSWGMYAGEHAAGTEFMIGPALSCGVRQPAGPLPTRNDLELDKPLHQASQSAHLLAGYCTLPVLLRQHFRAE